MSYFQRQRSKNINEVEISSQCNCENWAISNLFIIGLVHLNNKFTKKTF